MARLIEIGTGEGPVNEGERRVLATLIEQLPDAYSIIPNVEIADPGGQRWEYDAIVVAPHAVYAIETKEWTGRIRGDEQEWLVNGRSRKAPMLAAGRKAKILKNRMVYRAQVLARVWAEAAVVLATDPEHLDLTAEAARRVFALTDIVGFITDPSQVGQRPDAIIDLQTMVVKSLTPELRARTGPLVFGPYEVV